MVRIPEIIVEQYRIVEIAFIRSFTNPVISWKLAEKELKCLGICHNYVTGEQIIEVENGKQITK
jgi:hypothetical protein